MLIITAVLPKNVFSNFPFQMSQLMKKNDKRDVKGASI